MNPHEKLALKVALCVGVVAATVSLVDDIVIHPQDFRDTYYTYYRYGGFAFWSELIAWYVGLPAVLAIVCGGLVLVWDGLFVKRG